jgi:cell wall-associated NlpC family hydrolase
MFKKFAASIAVTAAALIIFAVSALANETGYVTASALNVRSAPSTSAEIIGQVYNGASVSIIAAEGAWYKINYNSSTGYVHGDYVSLKRDAVPTSRGAGTSFGASVVEYAKKFIGVPYQYGGNGPYSFDCSGYVKYVFANFGVSLPRTSYSQMSVGTAVSRENLQPGDLVFFRSGGHVGIYVGNNQYIHAPESGRTVSIDPMTRTLYTARRISR